MTDKLKANDRTYLEKLRLAAEVLLREGGETDLVTDALESELVLVREKVECALLREPSIHHPA